MARQALYRKWRSQTFAEVIGQEHITQTLQNAIAINRIAHAYLFTGPRGTGKTSTARILAKAVNCVGEGGKPCNTCSICRAVTEGRLMDLIEIDAASNTSVDDIRDLRDKIGFRPSEAKTKFYIIDEVHMLSKSAFNALLKTLEEPPDHVIFVLATTEPEKIPATITSRCQRFDFRRIKVEDVADRLRFILKQEDLQAEDAALTFIAHQGAGSMRDAISLMDQLTAYGQDTITLELVRSVLGAANIALTGEFVDCLLAGDIGVGLDKINEVINGGVDPRQFTLETLEYLRGLLLLKYGQSEQTLNLPQDMLGMMKKQIADISAVTLLQATRRFNRAIKDFKTSASEAIIPQLPLELAFIESVLGETQAEKKQPSAFTSVQTYTVTPKAAPAPQPLRVAHPPPPAPPETQPAPKAPVEQPEQPAKAVANGEASLPGIQAAWRDILLAVKKRSPVAEALLRSGMLVDVQESRIRMSFPSQILKERADKVKPKIIEALDSVLGFSAGIEFLVGAKGASTPAVTSAPLPSTAQKAVGYTPPEDDELIKTALELGGQIKEK